MNNTSEHRWNYSNDPNWQKRTAEVVTSSVFSHLFQVCRLPITLAFQRNEAFYGREQLLLVPEVYNLEPWVFVPLDQRSGNERPWKILKVLVLAPVVQKLDSAIHRMNHYPVDKC